MRGFYKKAPHLTGQMLKHERRFLGLSRQEVAAGAKMANAQLSDYEHGVRRMSQYEFTKLRHSMKQVVKARNAELLETSLET